jgi:hypothetical protein
MWTVVNKSTGLVVARFGTKAHAQYWMSLNDYDLEGNEMGLYEIRKAS